MMADHVSTLKSEKPEQWLSELDHASAPGFLFKGLKREQLVATNSMLPQEVFFDSLGDESEPEASLREALGRASGLLRSSASRVHNSRQNAGRRLRLGSADLVATRSKSSPTDGRRIADTPWPAARPFSRSTCASFPIAPIAAFSMAAINRAAAQRAYPACGSADSQSRSISQRSTT